MNKSDKWPRNPLVVAYTTITEKQDMYTRYATAGALAYDVTGATVPLANIDVNNVEFIKKKWRVQTPCTHKIVQLEDSFAVLGERLKIHTGTHHFEYYAASRSFTWDEYGVRVPSVFSYNRVVAHYATDNKDYWVWGDNVTDASICMSLQVYHDCQDKIHAIICRNQNSKKR